VAPARLEPADVAYDDDGTPRSARYGDVYHSAASGPGQARHVFLGGNGLPARWAARRAFAVLELGFGLGVNFVATWRAWRDDANRPRQLHYVAIDRHPAAPDVLATVLARDADLAPLARELGARLPPPLPGTHRRAFDDGRVVLTLVYDDVETALRRLEARADAIYLDGFAPSRNPAMWSAPVLRAVARHAARDATVATWSAARAVRDALAAAGFDVERREGFGTKRDMLVGRHAPRGGGVAGERADAGERRAIVVGAGLAGSSAAASLAARDWHVTVVDAAPAPASGASSLHAGTFHPIVTRDDSLLARLTRAAFLHALDRWRDPAIAWSRCGVLQLARRHVDEARFTDDARPWPATYVEAVDAAEGARRAGLPVERAGLWYPDGGWARAPTIVAAWLARAARFAAGARVASLARRGERWTVLDARGDTIAEAPVVVLANAADLARLAPFGAPLASVRGQASYLPADALAPPRAVVIGHGYVLPAIDGRVVVGSSYDLGATDAAPSAASHAGNLERLRGLAPALAVHADPATLDGGVGFRAVVADRMPLVGPLPDPADDGRGDRVAGAPGLYAIGAFGSRGLTWAALAGELLASHVDGGPLPVEADLADAVDPRRFVRRARRRRGDA
jgi:tRNA 5-methylaminomethyl-2-thiouridine biosynthesis bifunctional protein